MKQREKKPLQLLQVGVGTMLSSMAVAGFLLGYMTDVYLGTLPVFFLSFGFLGLLGGIMKSHQMLINVPDLKSEKAKQRSRSKY